MEYCLHLVVWDQRGRLKDAVLQAANHCFESHWVVESALSKLSGKAIGVEEEDLTEEQRESFRCACIPLMHAHIHVDFRHRKTGSLYLSFSRGFLVSCLAAFLFCQSLLALKPAAW